MEGLWNLHNFPKLGAEVGASIKGDYCAFTILEFSTWFITTLRTRPEGPRRDAGDVFMLQRVFRPSRTTLSVWRLQPRPANDFRQWPLTTIQACRRRNLSISGILLPPAVFGGLLITLWAYKCLMMVIFQNRIIYMPNLPPFSRSEKVSDYEGECRPIKWSEETLKTSDGVLVKLLKASGPQGGIAKKQCVILYFQGNASSLPPRLPYLSQTLKLLLSGGSKRNSVDSETRYTIAALSYRGYWTSRGRRPTEQGIKLDAQAAIDWVYQNHDSEDTTLILWGQSIGAGVATTALAAMLENKPRANVHLVLETPFTELKDLLIALYPQKFLPYRYLWPFLRSQWDTSTAFMSIGQTKREQHEPQILVLQAENDEIVPTEVTDTLVDIGVKAGLSMKREVVRGANHQDVMMKATGRQLVSKFVLDITGRT